MVAQASQPARSRPGRDARSTRQAGCLCYVRTRPSALRIGEHTRPACGSLRPRDDELLWEVRDGGTPSPAPAAFANATAGQGDGRGSQQCQNGRQDARRPHSEDGCATISRDHALPGHNASSVTPNSIDHTLIMEIRQSSVHQARIKFQHGRPKNAPARP